MNYRLPDIRSIDVKGKRVFLRSDLDAPVKEVKSQKSKVKIEVEDDTRLVASMPTLKYLLKHGAQVILAGHLRRPEKYDPKLSLLPVAEWIVTVIPAPSRGGSAFGGKAGIQKTWIPDQVGDDRKEKLGEFNGWRLSDQLFLLENLRFYKEEKENNQEFAKKLAALADIYVNDAFASSHRKHASIIGVPKILPHFAGIHLQKEIQILSEIMENPKRPLVVIVGGEKIETKLPLIEKMHRLSDYVLVGGKIAEENRELLRVQHEKVTSPEGGQKSVLLVAELNEDKMDITPKSTENFLQIINLSKTVVWNGPLGKTENSHVSEEGSRTVAKGILKSGAYSVVGGGDTLEFLKKEGILDKFSFFSTGGGAMLAFLSGEKLPGIEALKNS